VNPEPGYPGMDGPGFFISDDISWFSILAALAPIGIIICLIAVVDEIYALIRKRQKRPNDRMDPPDKPE
jgi:hypothetical protein